MLTASYRLLSFKLAQLLVAVHGSSLGLHAFAELFILEVLKRVPASEFVLANVQNVPIHRVVIVLLDDVEGEFPTLVFNFDDYLVRQLHLRGLRALTAVRLAQGRVVYRNSRRFLPHVIKDFTELGVFIRVITMLLVALAR